MDAALFLLLIDNINIIYKDYYINIVWISIFVVQSLQHCG